MWKTKIEVDASNDGNYNPCGFERKHPNLSVETSEGIG
jgi:hypothetical protein